MPHFVLISVLLAVSISAAWYWVFLQLNRRRAVRVLRWLEDAIAAHGQISAVEWLSASQFRARLRLPELGFRQPLLYARMAPREMPLRWALWRLRRQEETITFEANLNCVPRVNMEIGRTRWTGLTRRFMGNISTWPMQTVATLFISTQPEWEPEISGRMTSVVSTRELEFTDISFRSRAPNFSCTLPLEPTLESCAEFALFDSLRELAEGSPTSRM